MLYTIELDSAICQCESAVSIHMSPHLEPPSLPPPISSYSSGLSQGTRRELPVSHNKPPLAIYFVYGNVCVSALLSPLISPSPSPTVPTSLCSMSVSPLLPYKWVHQHHFSRFHIHVLIYNVCFPLSDLFHRP